MTRSVHPLSILPSLPSFGTREYLLVVEDDGDLRESLLDALEHGGYRAVGAADGEEALAKLRAAARLPCLILLDLMMPRVDGWEFRTRQQADPALAVIPVAVLTAHVTRPPPDFDAAAWLRKPVELRTLLDVAARFCGCGDEI